MATHFKTELEGADDHAKLQSLCKLTYKEQAVWFLNAFWEGGLKGGSGMESNSEQMWNYVDKASVIDNAKATGNALDELEAHRFLEAFDEAHTVLQMRSQLRKTGALGQNERPKEVPLTHFLLDKYEVDWHKLVNAPQGDNSAQIAEAQDKLQAVQDAFDVSAKADAEAAAALNDARSKENAAVAAENEAVAAENAAKAREADAVATENEAKAREAEAREAEAPFKAAQEEVEAALAEVKAQEDAYNSKTESLKKASEEGGVVSRNKAKVSLDAHLAEDPLPLRKAKITLEAAQKRADKARAPFQAATEVAAAARAEAEAARKAAESARADATSRREQAAAARQQAEEAKARAEAAVAAAQAAVAEAEAFLEELKANPGSGQGALWWIDRELTEKKKYMPVSKGGIR
eukprot:CAMPEP_0201508310 /NCGR_PEP_ID=MMETSP0161_2-20130828/1717_1 /ASSEMBLY_ACC=CAM_ASM_000251 /TAXON_ID=180227 /ORGANISM="Neoparamoeba aestuarina, Strain SoJaBio B1-5/56/2" /LENGTH=406 /DNA_ID=CAMNT_0047902941 /DNA_START=107 /DNA_END=1327 /DNA_ORIENTATION=-